MPTFLVDRRVRAAGDIYELVKERIGVIRATKWMFSGMEELGGRSPVQAIRAGDIETVRIFAELT